MFSYSKEGAAMDSQLPFAIDKKSDIPIWVQIRQRMAFCIVSGKYQPGDQLPTVRELAIQLDVNYHTVNKVYRDLENSGMVEVLAGKGTFVSDLSQARYLVLEGDVHAVVADCATKLLELGMTPEDAVRNLASYLDVSVEITPANAESSGERELSRHAG